ncbi:unnamed protein product [Cuscuta campestris]|uniref:Uncharacterized protein n=1 Tax=Cuscuta campestris TaxID=132261 RepID=A0A484M6P9_9ASTE|nr:unnamed protein product [Cuscuta campestris]
MSLREYGRVAEICFPIVVVLQNMAVLLKSESQLFVLLIVGITVGILFMQVNQFPLEILLHRGWLIAYLLVWFEGEKICEK